MRTGCTRGRVVLETLFPGITSEMNAQGGISLDISRDFRWFANGGFHQPTDSGMEGLLISRPRLEAGVRSRVAALPNVHISQQCDVEGLLFNDDRTRVIGVRLVRRDQNTPKESLLADLVVDASGRGTRSPAWLVAAGYDAAPEDAVKIDLRYTTREYRRRPDELSGIYGFAIANSPENGRTGVVLAQEDNRWIVTLGGFDTEAAPSDPEGFAAFAQGMPTPAMYEFLRTAEPIGDAATYRYGANLRRHYERLTRFPDGYLVFGDALCSFNPVYAQGMTVAANEAMALQDVLKESGVDLARRFFRAVAPVIDVPWNVAVGNDKLLPHVQGTLSRMDRFINWYIGKVHIAARTDAVVSVAFLRVVNMMAPAPGLLQPNMLWRVIRGNFAHPRQQAAAAPQTL